MLLQARVFLSWSISVSLGGPRHLCAKLGIYTSPAFISSSVAVCPLFSWYRADFSDSLWDMVVLMLRHFGQRWEVDGMPYWGCGLHVFPRCSRYGAHVWICGLPMGGAFWKVVAFAAFSCTTMQVLGPDMAHAINNTCLQDAAFSCWLAWANWNHTTVQKTHTHKHTVLAKCCM